MTALHSILSEGRGEGRDTNAAVVDALTGASIDYGSLDRLSDRLRDRLVHLGVKPGDRVGAYLRKSIDGVASIFGILKSGAAYVPVDPTAPASRNAYIHHNCAVSAVIVEKRLAEAYRKAFEGLGDALPPMILLDEVGGSIALEAALDELQSADPAPVAETVDPGDDALAYILYTSGSTGKPKGVMLTHDNLVISAENANAFDHFTRDEQVIAYLPLAWVGDHMFSYAQSYAAGYCVCCPESPETVNDDRREIAPPIST